MDGKLSPEGDVLVTDVRHFHQQFPGWADAGEPLHRFPVHGPRQEDPLSDVGVSQGGGIGFAEVATQGDQAPGVIPVVVKDFGY